MVKHPKYQAQDVGRMEETPRAFERCCPESYRLEIVKARNDPPAVGAVPRPTFRVLDEKGDLVAHFHPYGHSECHRKDFREIYEKMQKDIEKAGTDALKAWEKNNDGW